MRARNACWRESRAAMPAMVGLPPLLIPPGVEWAQRRTPVADASWDTVPGGHVGAGCCAQPQHSTPLPCSQVVPFFFYRGLERLTYTWSDRAFQALFTVLYAGQWRGVTCRAAVVPPCSGGNTGPARHFAASAAGSSTRTARRQEL